MQSTDEKSAPFQIPQCSPRSTGRLLRSNVPSGPLGRGRVEPEARGLPPGRCAQGDGAACFCYMHLVVAVLLPGPSKLCSSKANPPGVPRAPRSIAGARCRGEDCPPRAEAKTLPCVDPGLVRAVGQSAICRVAALCWVDDGQVDIDVRRPPQGGVLIGNSFDK